MIAMIKSYKRLARIINYLDRILTSHNIYIDKQIQLIQNLDKSKMSKLRILTKNVIDQTKNA